MRKWNVEVHFPTQVITMKCNEEFACTLNKFFKKRKVLISRAVNSTYTIDFSKVMFIKFVEITEADQGDFMKFSAELESLKSAYRNAKEKKEILQGVIGLCRFLRFDSQKTSTMVAIVAGVLPCPGEKFSDLPEVNEEERLMIANIIEENQLSAF